MLTGLLAPVSESYLRRLVRSCGVPLDPSVEGVRQETFEDLERTLLALAAEYVSAEDSGNEALTRFCRRAVITGRDHALLAARRAVASAEDRSRKEEMAAWMLLWLENPALFPRWLALRKKAGALPG